MRIAFTGVSHWHLPLYLNPVLELADAEVVGVADPDPAVADRVAGRIGCAGWGSWREMLDSAEPEFVFVLGRHCDMAEVCRELLARRIPFAVEKPAGVDAAEVAQLAVLQARTGSFAAVPFVFRQSELMRLLESEAPGDPAVYLAFKFIAGSVDRYRGGSEWMLSRETAGGGCTLNLGIHFIDLARVLLGPDLRVTGAMMSNALEGLDVEDHGVVMLKGERGSALVETGYAYPAAHLDFDLHFSVRTRRHHFAAADDRGVAAIAVGGEPVFHPMPVSNVAYYPVFVRDVLARAARGERPVAGLDELSAAMRLVTDAYELAPLGSLTST
jgi:predicted dehydrogenase